MAENDGLKDKTARTLKWNLIDRLRPSCSMR